MTSTVLVAKDDGLYQVRTAKALEIPAVESSTVENDLSLDGDIEDATEFSILANSSSDSDSVEIGSRCLALVGDAAGALINMNGAACWARQDQSYPKLKIKSKSTEEGPGDRKTSIARCTQTP